MRPAVIAALALCATACFSDATAPVSASGSYSLVSVNGTALPFTFSNGVVLSAESLVLDANGTFQDLATRADGTVVIDVGTYSVIGNTIVFGDQTVNLLYQGTLSGSTLTTQVGTYTERWQKR